MKITKLYSTVLFCVVTFIVNAQHLEKTDITKEPRYQISPINNSSLPNEECYCYYYNDFNDYIFHQENFIDKLASHLRKQWYNGQKELLKEEIEDRMNKEYSSFEEAQYDFFNQNFGQDFSNFYLLNARNVDVNLRRNSLREYNKTYVTRRILQYAQNTSNDFGYLTYNNKAIENMSYLEMYNLFNQYNTENASDQINWEYHNNRILKNDWVKQNKLYENYVTQQYINHVNSFSLSDRVTLMTGYLIYDWQNQPLVILPPQQFGGVPFYYPSQLNLETKMNSFINNANIPFNKLKRLYSMMKQHLGNLSASFYGNKSFLIDEGGAYQERDNYSAKRRGMLKKLAECFLQDEPLISDNDWEGVQSWGQNSDRPEQLMNVKLSHDALSAGFKDFGNVLEALGNYPELNTQKGALLKKLIDKNAPNNVDLSSFTDEDLGLIFDFDDRGIDYLGLQFSDYAMSLILEIEHGDNQYGWSLFTDEFKVDALHALANGGQVDFDKETIISSSVPECVKTIIKKMLNNHAYIDLGDMPDFVKNELNLIGNIFDVFSNSPAYHLNYQVGPLDPDSQGRERTASTKFNIITKGFDITLNEDYVSNATDLAIARTIIHESLHAYIEFIYHTQLFSDLRESLSYLLEQNGDNPNTAQHILMTQNFVDAIANSLESWDDSSLIDNSYYYFMSWSWGMIGTPAYNALNNNIQTNIINANTNEGNVSSSANSNALGTKNCN